MPCPMFGVLGQLCVSRNPPIGPCQMVACCSNSARHRANVDSFKKLAKEFILKLQLWRQVKYLLVTNFEFERQDYRTWCNC